MTAANFWRSHRGGRARHIRALRITLGVPPFQLVREPITAVHIAALFSLRFFVCISEVEERCYAPTSEQKAPADRGTRRAPDSLR